jgi:hypothetical protein
MNFSSWDCYPLSSIQEILLLQTNLTMKTKTFGMEKFFSICMPNHVNVVKICVNMGQS